MLTMKPLLESSPIFNKYINKLLARESNPIASLSKEFKKEERVIRNMLALPEAQERIKDEIQKYFGIDEADALQLTEELKTIAYSNIDNYISLSNGQVSLKDWGSIPKPLLSCIKEVKQTITAEGDTILNIVFWDKMQALALLTKILGLEKKTIKHTGSVGVYPSLFAQEDLDIAKINNTIDLPSIVISEN